MSYEVVVIGSGVSGLAAASELIENGHSNVAVVEAQDYVGGRTHTVPVENGYIEFGAQWIHGAENNPIYDVLKSLDLTDEDTKTVFGDMNYATQDGAPVAEEFVDEINEKIDEMYDKVQETIGGLGEGEDRSFGELLNEAFEETLNSMINDKGLDAGQVATVRAIYEARMKEEKNDTASGDLKELSAQGWNSFKDSAGDNMIIPKLGYGALVDHLKNKLPEGNIFLNEVVKKIDYSGDEVVISTQNRKTNKSSQFSAQYCICTIPLGVLKANHSSLFQPSLPDNKVQAIQNLGFGLMNKFFLVFDGQPFDDNVQGFQVLWRNDINFKLDAEKKHKLQNPFYRGFSTFELWAKNKSVMYSFLTGAEGAYSETLSDQCLLEVIHELLQKCFPDTKVPVPKKIFRSKWLSNEFVRGAYTSLKLGSSTSDVEALAEPIDGKLLFAGEATSIDFVSTVHGAFATGQREAQRIINPSE